MVRDLACEVLGTLVQQDWKNCSPRSSASFCEGQEMTLIISFRLSSADLETEAGICVDMECAGGLPPRFKLSDSIPVVSCSGPCCFWENRTGKSMGPEFHYGSLMLQLWGNVQCPQYALRLNSQVL